MADQKEGVPTGVSHLLSFRSTDEVHVHADMQTIANNLDTPPHGYIGYLATSDPHWERHKASFRRDAVEYFTYVREIHYGVRTYSPQMPLLLTYASQFLSGNYAVESVRDALAVLDVEDIARDDDPLHKDIAFYLSMTPIVIERPTSHEDLLTSCAMAFVPLGVQYVVRYSSIYDTYVVTCEKDGCVAMKVIMM